MAPTKPLVAQQIEACYELMSINQDDIAEMTGTTQPSERLMKWRNKRIFFLTPQIIANDLITNGSEMNPDKIKCLVIDEAHKATGNYAYCQVVRALLQYTQQFRIVALSATPGRAANVYCFDQTCTARIF
uniref:Helicase ATP-binding domain-containing protein n=1 Tax=Romanomermis culicivorax TaxID=13658 RepID=A0A915JSC2_ROMCU